VHETGDERRGDDESGSDEARRDAPRRARDRHDDRGWSLKLCVAKPRGGLGGPLRELGATGAARQVRVEEGALELGELTVDAQRHPEPGASAKLSTCGLH
jgi:hypothetical protein